MSGRRAHRRVLSPGRCHLAQALGLLLVLVLTAPLSAAAQSLPSPSPQLPSPSSPPSGAPAAPSAPGAASADTTRSDSAEASTPTARFRPHPAYAGGAEVVDDSLLRWRPNRYLIESIAAQSGLRLQSTGSPLRPAAITDLGSGLAGTRLILDHLDRTDPVTGQLDPMLPSPRMIASLRRSDLHGVGRWEGFTRDLYLNRPRLYLFFNEAGDAVRDLDVQYALNPRKDLNVELGYHDLRDGLTYSGSGGQSSIVRARAWYQPDGRWMIRAGYETRSAQLDESFGYTTAPLSAFTFNPLLERPLISGVRSTRERRDAWLYGEFDPGEDGRSRFTAGLLRQGSKRSLIAGADSIDAGFNRVGGFMRHDRTTRTLRATVEGRVQWDRLRGRSLPAPDDGAIATVRLDGDLHWTPTPRLAATAFFGLIRRSDLPSAPLAGLSIRHGTPTGAGLSLQLASVRAPAPYQTRYWTSLTASGTPDLPSERRLTAGLRAWVHPWRSLRLHAEAQAARVESTPWLDPTGHFAASRAYHVIAFNGGARFAGSWLEADAGADYRIHLLDGVDGFTTLLDASGSRLRLVGSAHLKTPVFERAAFVRAGLTSQLVPLAEVAPAYDARLDRWNPIGDTRLIPAHFVLDGDATIRLRWMMLTLRWENLLDRVAQPGYFQTPGYPMPGRRFHFGISVLFKN